MDKPSFIDTSTAPAIEKAKRVLSYLSDGVSMRYFFEDGYARNDEIRQDSGAALAVLADLEVQRDQLLELVNQSYRKQNCEYLELLRKYAGTKFEHDPAIVRAREWVKKADELIAKARGR